MPKLRVLSGREVLKIRGHFGFARVAQRGSHIRVARRNAEGITQSLTVPNHGEIDRGTLLAIFRQASRYVAQSELRPWFFSE